MRLVFVILLLAASLTGCGAIHDLTPCITHPAECD